MIGRHAELAAGPSLAAIMSSGPSFIIRRWRGGSWATGRGGADRRTKSAVGDAAQHLERVAHVEADVGEPLVADVGQRDGDAVDEWLAADEAVVGQQVGAVSEVLPRAEADFEVERAVVAEQPLRR